VRDFELEDLTQCGEDANQSSNDRNQEAEEHLMIPSADAIIDPWAVMIKSFHALIADTAMPRPLSPNDLAVGTQ
jgi:hypothetical protein